jgi:hypothetical protein
VKVERCAAVDQNRDDAGAAPQRCAQLDAHEVVLVVEPALAALVPRIALGGDRQRAFSSRST